VLASEQVQEPVLEQVLASGQGQALVGASRIGTGTGAGFGAGAGFGTGTVWGLGTGAVAGLGFGAGTGATRAFLGALVCPRY
jgi:hypothetical protein